MAAVIGLLVGSFLNVVVYRVPRALSVLHPPSFCPRCRTPVRPRDNVPVLSWLMLRGRCRACGEPIAGRYPAVEAATALLFALVALVTGARWALPAFCAVLATVGVSVLVARDGLRVPASIPVTGSSVAAALFAVAAVADHRWSALVGAAGGGAVGVLVLLPGRERSQGTGARAQTLPVGLLCGWLAGAGAWVGAAAGAAVFVGWVLAVPGARNAVMAQGDGAARGSATLALAGAAASMLALAVAVSLSGSAMIGR